MAFLSNLSSRITGGVQDALQRAKSIGSSVISGARRALTNQPLLTGGISPVGISPQRVAQTVTQAIPRIAETGREFLGDVVQGIRTPGGVLGANLLAPPGIGLAGSLIGSSIPGQRIQGAIETGARAIGQTALDLGRTAVDTGVLGPFFPPIGITGLSGGGGIQDTSQIAADQITGAFQGPQLLGPVQGPQPVQGVQLIEPAIEPEPPISAAVSGGVSGGATTGGGGFPSRGSFSPFGFNTGFGGIGGSFLGGLLNRDEREEEIENIRRRTPLPEPIPTQLPPGGTPQEQSVLNNLIRRALGIQTAQAATEPQPGAFGLSTEPIIRPSGREPLGTAGQDITSADIIGLGRGVFDKVIGFFNNAAVRGEQIGAARGDQLDLNFGFGDTGTITGTLANIKNDILGGAQNDRVVQEAIGALDGDLAEVTPEIAADVSEPDFTETGGLDDDFTETPADTERATNDVIKTSLNNELAQTNVVNTQLKSNVIDSITEGSIRTFISQNGSMVTSGGQVIGIFPNGDTTILTPEQFSRSGVDPNTLPTLQDFQSFINDTLTQSVQDNFTAEGDLITDDDLQFDLSTQLQNRVDQLTTELEGFAPVDFEVIRNLKNTISKEEGLGDVNTRIDSLTQTVNTFTGVYESLAEQVRINPNFSSAKAAARLNALDRKFRLQITPLTRELDRLETKRTNVLDIVQNRFNDEMNILELQMGERDRVTEQLDNLRKEQRELTQDAQATFNSFLQNPQLIQGATEEELKSVLSSGGIIPTSLLQKMIINAQNQLNLANVSYQKDTSGDLFAVGFNKSSGAFEKHFIGSGFAPAGGSGTGTTTREKTIEGRAIRQVIDKATGDVLKEIDLGFSGKLSESDRFQIAREWVSAGKGILSRDEMLNQLRTKGVKVEKGDDTSLGSRELFKLVDDLSRGTFFNKEEGTVVDFNVFFDDWVKPRGVIFDSTAGTDGGGTVPPTDGGGQDTGGQASILNELAEDVSILAPNFTDTGGRERLLAELQRDYPELTVDQIFKVIQQFIPDR